MRQGNKSPGLLFIAVFAIGKRFSTLAHLKRGVRHDTGESPASLAAEVRMGRSVHG